MYGGHNSLASGAKRAAPKSRFGSGGRPTALSHGPLMEARSSFTAARPKTSPTPATAPPAAGTAPPAAGSAAGAGGPGGVPPMPFNAEVETQLSGLQRGQEAALAAIAAKEASTQQAFYDPNDPRARQNALRRAFRERRDSQQITMAGAGQLYSGANQTQQARTDIDQGMGEADLKQEYDAIMGSLAGDRRRIVDDTAFQRDQVLARWRDAYAQDTENTPVGTGDQEAQLAAFFAALAGQPKPAPKAKAKPKRKKK